MARDSSPIDAEGFLRKIPPHSLDAEEAVLGAVMIDPAALDRIVDVVAAGDFYQASHRIVFGVLLEMFDRREPLDLVTLTAILRSRGKLADVGGASYLSGLLERTPTAANVVSYARIVADKATQRRLIDASLKNLSDAYENPESVRDLVALAEARVAEVGDDAQPIGAGTMGEAISDAVAIITTKDTRRIPTGYPFIDESIGGFKFGSQWIVAGRPGSLKSVVAEDIMFAAAFNGIGSVMLSLEMTRGQLLLRRVAKDLGIVNMRLQLGFTHEGRSLLSEDERARALAQLRTYERLPIWILDDELPWPTQTRRLRRLKRQHPNIGQVVIDHVRLVTGVPGLREDQERERIGVVSGWGRGFAKEAKVNVLLVSQLNRESEKQNREPMMADLALCGNLEQDAHGIIFAHTPDKESAGEKEEEFLLSLGKNRDGPKGRYRMRAVRKFCRIIDPIEEQRSTGTTYYDNDDDDREGDL